MDYQVVDAKTGEPLDVLELHVLARAYYAAWRVVRGPEPEGRHSIPTLHTNIDFNRPRSDKLAA